MTEFGARIVTATEIVASHDRFVEEMQTTLNKQMQLTMEKACSRLLNEVSIVWLPWRTAL